MLNWIKAWFQWVSVGSVLLILSLIGLLVVPFTILCSRKMENFVGEIEQEHSDRYKAQGSSGKWEYWATDIPFLSWFCNHEDGNLGEPSGKHSARCGGNERSFWNQYQWLALRNPVNKLKRTNEFFHCKVNACVIEWKGDETVDDKGFNWGSQLVIATNIRTKKKYYGYRKCIPLGNGYCRQYRFGFKVKPSHANNIQDADDLDKAFTMRAQFKSKID